MGFHLMAFFAKGEKSIINDAKKKWPGCKGKLITSPFKGIGVAGPYIHNADTEEEHEKAIGIAYDIQDDLPEFSKKYPETVFVFVEADCAGGTCFYEGYVCKNGKIIEKQESKKTLKPLVKHLGIDLEENQFFEPFQRDFFD